MRIALLLAVLLVVSLPAFSQNSGDPNPSMMSGPMGGGMMGGGQGMGMGGGQGMGGGMMGGGMGQGMGMRGMMGKGMGMGGGQGMQGMCPMCSMMGMSDMLPGGMCLLRAGGLGLTDDQTSKIQNIHTDFRREQIKTGSEIQLAQLDLQQELMKDNPDTSKVGTIIKRINGLQAEVQIAAMKSWIAARNVLTPEQRQKCKSMMMGRPMTGGMMPMMPQGGGGMQPMAPGAGGQMPPMQH
jgi:Spy/CpxP family protein refolding chaperone